MSSYFQDVQDFHKVVCQIDAPRRPQVPTRDRKALRVAIMKEEWTELTDAIEANDLVEIADACADLVVTVLGTADEYGIPFDAVWAEVHRSNMAKAGGPVRDDGKRLKPPGWTPPDVAGVLDQNRIECPDCGDMHPYCCTDGTCDCCDAIDRDHGTPTKGTSDE